MPECERRDPELVGTDDGEVACLLHHDVARNDGGEAVRSNEGDVQRTGKEGQRTAEGGQGTEEDGTARADGRGDSQ